MTCTTLQHNIQEHSNETLIVIALLWWVTRTASPEVEEFVKKVRK
jgi:hypothetical protein